MYIEKSKTIIADGTQGDYLRDSARHLLNVYRLCAIGPDAPETMRKAWADIKVCLEASSDDLTEAQKQRWERLYLSYLAEGNPPAPELTAAYKHYKEVAVKEKWPVVPLSDAVRSVIAGMSALPPSTPSAASQRSIPNGDRQQHAGTQRGNSSIAIDVVLAFLCAAYLGYQHDPYMAVVICSLIWAGYFLWMNRDLVKKAKAQTGGGDSVPAIIVRLTTVLLFVSVAVGFLAIGSAAYFSMAHLHG